MDIKERFGGGRKSFYSEVFIPGCFKLIQLLIRACLWQTQPTLHKNVSVLQGTEMFLSKHLRSRCNTYIGNNKIITVGGMNSDHRMPVAH